MDMYDFTKNWTTLSEKFYEYMRGIFYAVLMNYNLTFYMAHEGKRNVDITDQVIAHTRHLCLC